MVLRQWHTSRDNSHQAFSALFVLQATIAAVEGLGTRLGTLTCMQIIIANGGHQVTSTCGLQLIFKADS